MTQQATLGTNRTGIAAAPQRSQEMRTGMEEFPPTSEGSAQDIARVRIAYAKEAEPLGSMPLPAGMTKKEDRDENCDGSTANTLSGQARRTPGV